MHVCAAMCWKFFCRDGAHPPRQAEGNHLLSCKMDLEHAACGMLPRRIDTRPPFVITLDFFYTISPGGACSPSSLVPRTAAYSSLFYPGGSLSPPQILRPAHGIVFTVLSQNLKLTRISHIFHIFNRHTPEGVCQRVVKQRLSITCSTDENCHKNSKFP